MTTGSDRLLLRVLTRHEPHHPSLNNNNWTLFARLSPSVAQALYDHVVLLCQDESQAKQCCIPEFLPLVLKSSNMEDDDEQQLIYVSYNGGSIAEHGTLYTGIISSFIFQPMIEYSMKQQIVTTTECYISYIHVDFSTTVCLPSEALNISERALCVCVS